MSLTLSKGAGLTLVQFLRPLRQAQGGGGFLLDALQYICTVSLVAFYVYILLCADGSYYVGHTDDLRGRIAQHESGAGCLHTRSRLPVVLVFSQAFQDREYAKSAERQLKGWNRAKKEALISGKTHLLPALARCRTLVHIKG